MKDADSEFDDLLGIAALYTAGALTETERGTWEAALASREPDTLRATAALEPALLALSAEFEPIAPPTHIKTALLEAIAPPKGVLFRFAREDGFRPSPIPGIAFRLLSRDKAQGRVTCLLRLEPGARLAPHTHGGVEECLVLEGSVFVGQTRLKPGDYQHADAESDHVEQWTDTGALLYLSAPEELFLAQG